jgi:hypothetical protein
MKTEKKEHSLQEQKKMTNRQSPSVQGRIRRILSRVQIFRKEKEKYAEGINEENKRIQKDKILDEEEDEEKEEEDEYAKYAKKKR